ncbi:MAG: hypothetical protein MJ074_06840 [Oscillospiraceae bacterium]|nr:hypothetical protein [Oscillospiraceae bacterium]
MKHGKKPTVAQCRALEKNGLDHRAWLIERDLQHSMIVVHRETGERKVVEK